ncbi:hypothetical protein ABW21_db0205172 [Orbilia brochopaga]|nr:hypothetical protein ABW21_db0205172 [Drechslerella brochopaga]
MRHTILSVALFATIQFSFALAGGKEPHFYPLEARGDIDIPREMKKNGPSMTGLDITADLEVRGMLLNVRQTCQSGYGYCSQSGRCCPDPSGGGRCCDDGTCIVTGQTCCQTGDGTCRPGYRCVINSAGVRGCREGTSGGGGSSIPAGSGSGGGGVTRAPSPTLSPSPSPTPPPQTITQVEYRWYTTRITWYYYWYYYVWVATVDYTSTRSSQTSTITTISEYVSDAAEATSSFRALSQELASSTPTQDTTEFEGPTPTPITTSSSSISSSSSRSSAIPTIGQSDNGSSNGGGAGNVGGPSGGGASDASQYRARDALVFAPIVLLLTLVYVL